MSDKSREQVNEQLGHLGANIQAAFASLGSGTAEAEKAMREFGKAAAALQEAGSSKLTG